LAIKSAAKGIRHVNKQSDAELREIEKFKKECVRKKVFTLASRGLEVEVEETMSFVAPKLRE